MGDWYQQWIAFSSDDVVTPLQSYSMASWPPYSTPKKIDLITVDGGFPGSNVCHGGYRQFLGIENEVTQKIADWIKQYQASASAATGTGVKP